MAGAPQGYIGRNPSDGRTTINRQTFNVTSGVQTSFTFTSGYDLGYLDVYLNGVKQNETTDYTAADGSTFSFASSTPAVQGDTLEAIAYKSFNTTNVTGSTRDFAVGRNLDVSGNVTIGSSLTIASDLTVNGTYTYVNTEILDIEDKTIGIASTSSASNTTADGAGIIVYGGSDGDKSLTWNKQKSNWVLVGGGVSIGTGVTIGSSTANVLEFSVDGAVNAKLNNYGAFIVGDGVAGEAWGDNYKTVQAGTGAFGGNSPAASASSYWTTNSYFDAVNSRWEYIAADEASRLAQGDGALAYYNAGAGSADGAITWSERLRVDASGNLSLAGDGNTYISHPATDSLAVTTAGSERLRIDSSGRLLSATGGLTASRNVGTKTGQIQASNTGNDAAITIIGYSNDVAAPHFMFGKTRATNSTDNTIVQDDDRLGEIGFCGADGNDLESIAASIIGEVDGTPGSNDMPGRLVFSTTADGAATATERLRITSTGLISIGDNTNLDSQLTVTQAQGDCIRLRSVVTNNAFKYGIIKQEPYNNNAVGLHIIAGKSDSSYNEVAIGGGVDSGYAATSIDCYTGATTTTATGTRRFRITSDGKILAGGHTSGSAISAGGLESLNGSGNNFGAGRFVASAGGPDFWFIKSRNATAGSHTVVQSGDNTGTIQFAGSDGDSYTRTAAILSEVDGTPGDADMPGRLIFQTTADGASSPTERMRITSTGKVGINVNSPDKLLHVSETGNADVVTPFRLTNTGGSPSTEVRMEFECGLDEIATISAKNEGSDTGPLIFSTASSQGAYPSEKMRIAKDGQVGIGTDNPGSTLHLYKHSANHGIKLQRSGSNPGSVTMNVNSNGELAVTADNNISYASGGSQQHLFLRGATEVMRINSGGKVGIGTANPTNTLSVYGTNAGTSLFAIGRNAYFANDSNAYASVTFKKHTAHSDAIDYLQIRDSGNNNLASISGAGNWKPESGKGIDFSTHGNAGGMTSELLDDYEEGTWTAGVQDYSATYTNQHGYYTKVGDLVSVTCILSGNGSPGSGAMRVTSLPFTTQNTTAYRAVASVFCWTGFVTGGLQIVGSMSENSNMITILGNNNNANATTVNRSALNSSGWEFQVSIVYHAA